ncbi:carbohydrate binding domain-containing protein, partial [Microbacterium allomyrinae]|uniref:carbohydrate binding domain-containing protein n=1 Tax=Microbacterium allomyrinae TaxID=2830666 RepID=UPI0027E0C968
MYYQAPSGWSAANIHYQVGTGAWTTAPGAAMTAVDGFPGWFQATVQAEAGQTINAAFNNGSGAWDNNATKNYAIPSGGDKSVSGGLVTSGKPEKGDPLAGTLTLYYKPAGWTTAYAHYQVGSGTWTTAPGKQLTAVAQCTAGAGWFTTTIETGSAANVTVAFNNGSGAWDNNASKNYTLTTKVAAVSGGAVSFKDPCATTPTPTPTATPTSTPTPTPTNPTNVPGLPGGVTAASASSTSVAVSWTAVSGATKYEI